MILEKSVKRTHMTQALDPPSDTKKTLITNQVTTRFFVTLFESISYALHARSTDLSRMMARRPQHVLVLVLAIASLMFTPTTMAAQVDRLFSTAAQRAHLDQLRNRNAPEAPRTETSTVSGNQAPVVKKPDPVTLEGIVRRSDGSEAIWINGQVVQTQQPAGGIVIRQGPDQDHRVLVESTDTRRYARLKPGQTWDRQHRRVVENHQLQDDKP